MAPTTPSTISVEHISIPGGLPAFLHSLIELPNDPAYLYISVNSRSLIIYVAPASKVNVIDLSHLSVALHQEDESALALKHLLENGAAIKVFFDARTPAKILFDRCDIKLANKVCTKRTYIHEVQVMELALRQSDTDREWLAGLDKCISQDSGLDVNKLMPGSPYGVAEFDKRMLHLPVLWKKYYDRLAKGFNGSSFWIAMIREATMKRLEVSRGEKHSGYDANGARSGWDEDIIEEQTDSWNEELSMDVFTGGEFSGGDEHWNQFKIL